MSLPVCPNLNSRIDGTIAKYFGWDPKQPEKGMTPTKIVSLRGMYDTYASEKGLEPLLPMDNPSDEDLKNAAKKLMNFRAGTMQRHKVRIAKGIKNLDRSYKILRKVYTIAQRKSRINVISSLFSQEVDRLMAGGKVSRQSYIEGFVSKGEHVGGHFSILEGVYNNIMEARYLIYQQYANPGVYFKSAKENGLLNYDGAPETEEEFREHAKHLYKEYIKILDYWDDLIPFVLKDLVKKEGVKLGIKNEFLSVASSDSFGDNDIASKWDISESKKDGWMENSDLQSAFGSVGQKVRRILSTVPVTVPKPIFAKDNYADKKRGKYLGIEHIPVVDDLGFPVYMDPVKVHQILQETLKGVVSTEDMMIKLCKTDKDGKFLRDRDNNVQAKISWMQPLVQLLDMNQKAKTQFYVDLKRNFQPYSIMKEDKDLKTGLKKIKTIVLNKSKNYLKGKYEVLLSPKGKFSESVKMWEGVYKPVFDEKTKEIDFQRLAELRKLVLAWVHEGKQQDNTDSSSIFARTATYGVSTSPLINRDQNAQITINGKKYNITYNMKRDFLIEVFASLGFDVQIDTIDSILHSNDIYRIREQLEQLFDGQTKSGIHYAMPNNAKTLFNTLIASNKSNEEKEKALKEYSESIKSNKYEEYLSFRTLYYREVDGNTPVKEHADKILDIISKHQEGSRVESRVRYNDNTMYSFVSPSYLGDRLELIQSYVEQDNKKGLLAFLESEYLNSPQFVSEEYLANKNVDGIYNIWLREIVKACKSNKPLMDTVASIFTFERDLGWENKPFENFTTKEHALDMLIHFFADSQLNKGYGGVGKKDLNKRQSAMYPVFILGDAGVSKYIRAPRINSPKMADKKGKIIEDAADRKNFDHVVYEFDSAAENTILDSFFDIYLQERSRMHIDSILNIDFYANGKKVSSKNNEFTFLSFLNEERYAIPEDKKDNKEYVKMIIRKYLDDAAIGSEELEKQGMKSFIQRLRDLGVLDTIGDKGNTYKHIYHIANPNNIEKVVREFYWNTKLATIQQLQMMTIDPSFYHGTKDLQKRYKEIHAPGSILDVTAFDEYNNRLYSSDGIEKVVYFEDINVNSEVTNPAFMEAILRSFKLESITDKTIEDHINNGIITPKENEEEEKKRIKLLKELLGDNYSIYETYCKNTLTDGQGYRTLDSYRKVMGMAGKWEEEHENAYKAIKQIRERHTRDNSELTSNELQQIERLAVVFQPIKPYMFTHEKYEFDMELKDAESKPYLKRAHKLIPVQHKYAEAVIIPELLPKDSKLRELGLWMEENNIDMAGSTKIAKVGCYGQADISKSKDRDSLRTALSSGVVHTLPYRDYRIQTNVPEHINSSQLFGTQIRKLIMAGVNLNSDAELYRQYLEGVGNFEGTINLNINKDDGNDSVKLNGRNLLTFYNSLICANILDSYDKFADNARDIQKLSELLQQSTVGSMREAMDNIFSYALTGSENDMQKFVISLFEGGLEHDSAALILSTFKKIVNKQQISGGSAVQVSAFGIKGYEEDGNLRYVTDIDNPANVLYAEIEMPFDKSFRMAIKDASGNVTYKTVQLSFDKYCFPDGNIKPVGDPIKKGTDEWKKYQSYTYKTINGELVPCDYRDPQAQVYKPLIEQDYPGILSLVAYRIPTERDYSMINCQVKRFTSKVAGGTMKCPPEGTSIAGFDFDIDKLYFMLREYVKHYDNDSYTESNFLESDKNIIWSHVYRKYPEVANALQNARLASGDNKAALNSFWKEANIEEQFKLNKSEVFMDMAKSLDIKPSKVTTSNVTEWMEEYDFSKTPEQNSRASRNNVLISLIQARLQDPETFKQRYTPGGFTHASNAARFMRELFHGNKESIDRAIKGGHIFDLDLSAKDPEPNYDPTDPYTILLYNQQNQVASKLIGIFANQNANHAFASSMNVFRLKKPISFCGKEKKDLLHKDPKDAAIIDLYMAEFLAASVDAVKDPVLNYLNLNTITADAGAVLARLGYNTKEIGLLFNQPIIRMVCEETFNNNRSNAQIAIDDAIKMLQTSITGSSLSKDSLTAAELAQCILNERNIIDAGGTQENFYSANAEVQMRALMLFSDILNVSKDVSDFVLNTKFTASNAVSSTMGGMFAQQYKVQSYVEKFPSEDNKDGSLSYEIEVVAHPKTGVQTKPIDSDKSYLSMKRSEYLRKIRNNPFAYEQAMYDTNRWALGLLSKYYPYMTDAYTRARDYMSKLARYGSLNEEDINGIHSDVLVAMLAAQTSSEFNGEAIHKREGAATPYTNREYYREHFAGDLMEMLAEEPELGKLDIFKFMYPDTVTAEVKDKKGLTKTERYWTIVLQDMGGMDADTKEAIRESWEYLMTTDGIGNYDEEDCKELAKDLFMYCFYQHGFDFSYKSFMHLAPTEVKENIKVERKDSLPLSEWKTIKPNSNDIYVWSNNLFGHKEEAIDKYDAVIGRENSLQGKSYQLPDEITRNTVKYLIETALAHPELRFKIAKDLTQEDFDMFKMSVIGMDIPSNIYFSEGTLSNVTGKDEVSCDMQRTYPKFLEEILQDNDMGLNIEEFTKMWILNHLDNKKFVLDLDTVNKRTNEIIKEVLNHQEGSDNSSIILDFSNYTNEKDSQSLGCVMSYDKNAKISKWPACIKLNGSYYLAMGDVEGEAFNIHTGMQMQYIKVEPLGTSKNIQYDNGKVLTPRKQYQEYLGAKAPEVDNTDTQNNNVPEENLADNNPIGDSNDENNNQGLTPVDITGSREELEKELFKEMQAAIINKYGEMDMENVINLANDIKSASDKDLRDTVAAVRKACRENGILVLDDEGNMVENC